MEPPNINSQLRMTTAPPDVASKAGQIDMGHEAPSQGEASTASCGVGDPAAQAGGVATLERGGHAAASAIKVGGRYSHITNALTKFTCVIYNIDIIRVR